MLNSVIIYSVSIKRFILKMMCGHFLLLKTHSLLCPPPVSQSWRTGLVWIDSLHPLASAWVWPMGNNSRKLEGRGQGGKEVEDCFLWVVCEPLLKATGPVRWSLLSPSCSPMAGTSFLAFSPRVLPCPLVSFQKFAHVFVNSPFITFDLFILTESPICFLMQPWRSQ